MIRKLVRAIVASFKMVARDAILNVIPSSPLVPLFMRFLIYRAAGLKLQTFKVYPRCFFGGNQVAIGKGTFVSYGCFFDAVAPIFIGDRCAIANEVCFVTSFHAVGGPESRAGERTSKPIHIGNGCWIGARAMFLPGVSVGNGCIIGAGAVVTRDCEANALYGGVPARRIKCLDGHHEYREYATGRTIELASKAAHLSR